MFLTLERVSATDTIALWKCAMPLEISPLAGSSVSLQSWSSSNRSTSRAFRPARSAPARGAARSPTSEPLVSPRRLLETTHSSIPATARTALPGTRSGATVLRHGPTANRVGGAADRGATLTLRAPGRGRTRSCQDSSTRTTRARRIPWRCLPATSSSRATVPRATRLGPPQWNPARTCCRAQPSS